MGGGWLKEGEKKKRERAGEEEREKGVIPCSPTPVSPTPISPTLDQKVAFHLLMKKTHIWASK